MNVKKNLQESLRRLQIVKENIEEAGKYAKRIQEDTDALLFSDTLLEIEIIKHDLKKVLELYKNY